jgi:hypothetical protein
MFLALSVVISLVLSNCQFPEPVRLFSCRSVGLGLSGHDAAGRRSEPKRIAVAGAFRVLLLMQNFRCAFLLLLLIFVIKMCAVIHA